MIRLISLILIVMFLSCSFIHNPFDKTPKTWSSLLKTAPKQLQDKQNKLRDSMNNLKKD
jgi:hypothetical protein